MLFPVSAPEQAASAAEGTGGELAARRETVLLVEDETAVRRVLRGMLVKQGYRVIEASSPVAACAAFDIHARDIRLLVTDVVMPGMNGPALAQRLVGLQPRLAVLFISGYTDVDPMALGLGHRSVGFLSKPISAARLAAKIRELFVAL
jgi:DNA-binding NtrC family response regulator